MAEAVYVLCAITSVACCALLVRGWRSSGSRLLLWSAIGFAFLALNNILLFVDLVVIPTAIDLSLARSATALVAMSIVVAGLVWESR
ncbi:MAG: hypothetical protein HOW73_40625 [Polyangiaceae bacterium]|nr:hypothetical protein [Polyangiaceae bacterium]